MGLWATIREALGLVPPLVVSEPAPFEPTPRAKKALFALKDTTVRVVTEPAGPGRRRVVLEFIGVPMAGGALPLAVADHDREHLVGLKLDHDGTDFTVSLELEVRGSETPNPDVRLYEVSRPVQRGRPVTAAHGEEGVPDLAAFLLGVPGVRSLLLRGNVVSVEREPGVGWAALDRDVAGALRAWFVACGAIATSRADDAPRDEAWERIERAIEAEIQPYVHQHGGDIDLVDVKDKVVTVSLRGACASCPASILTLKGGVQRRLRELLPDLVERVEQVGGLAQDAHT